MMIDLLFQPIIWKANHFVELERLSQMHIFPIFQCNWLFVLNYKCCIELIEWEINTENGWMCVWLAGKYACEVSQFCCWVCPIDSMLMHIEPTSLLTCEQSECKFAHMMFTLSAQMCQKVCITKPTTCV